MKTIFNTKYILVLATLLFAIQKMTHRRLMHPYVTDIPGILRGKKNQKILIVVYYN